MSVRRATVWSGFLGRVGVPDTLMGLQFTGANGVAPVWHPLKPRGCLAPVSEIIAHNLSLERHMRMTGRGFRPHEALV